jgi:hypothetical protein
MPVIIGKCKRVRGLSGVSRPSPRDCQRGACPGYRRLFVWPDLSGSGASLGYVCLAGDDDDPVISFPEDRVGADPCAAASRPGHGKPFPPEPGWFDRDRNHSGQRRVQELIAKPRRQTDLVRKIRLLLDRGTEGIRAISFRFCCETGVFRFSGVHRTVLNKRRPHRLRAGGRLCRTTRALRQSRRSELRVG